MKKHTLIVLTLALALALALLGLLSYAWFQVSSGYLDSDALIFQAIGRAMLNGYKPYVDLFETKPPAVFLLHALSWKLTGSQLLVSVATVLALIGIPQVVLSRTLSLIQEKSPQEKQVLSLLTLLFGITLSLYIANQAGGGLAESYGAYFAVLFLGLVINGKWKMENGKRWLQIFVLGILLLCAVGFKEPFLLSILAGLLMLLPSGGFVNSLIRLFVLPLVIAIVIGVLGLLALGLFEPFFNVYLPHMLGFHIHQHDGSTLIRALEFWRVFLNMGAYSWGMAVAVSALWFGVAIRGNVHSLIRLFVATYLTLVAVAIGGDFYGHHFVFAVPFYVAIYWLWVRELGKSGTWERGSKVIVGAGLVFAALFNTQFDYRSQAAGWQQHEAKMQHAAATIDEVMDSCGWEKYLQMIPRVGDAFAYTDHVPYGPIFLHYSRFIGAKRAYQTAYIRALNDAHIALVLDLATSNLSEDAIEFMGVHFSETPPACAGEDFAQPEPYTLLFRKE